MTKFSISFVVLVGCAHSIGGGDPATPAQLASPVLATYECMSPYNEVFTDGAIRERFEPRVQTVDVRNGPTGHFAMLDNHAFTNHWTDKRGEHFFSVYALHTSATEVVIQPENDTAYLFTYYDQSNADVNIRTDPDGTVHPLDLPRDAQMCRSGKIAPGLRAAANGLLLMDLTRVPAASFASTHYGLYGCTLPMLGRKTDFLEGKDWEWMPNALLVDSTGTPHLFYLAGPSVLYRLVGDKPTFAIGGVVGLVKFDPKKAYYTVTGTLGDDPRSVDCEYRRDR